MTIQAIIEKKLHAEFTPSLLQVINESYMHSVPEGSESHFKVVIVSTEFDNKRKVSRHQLVYKALADEMAGPIHALALHTYTQSEWASQNETPQSPHCMGGGK